MGFDARSSEQGLRSTFVSSHVKVPQDQRLGMDGLDMTYNIDWIINLFQCKNPTGILLFFYRYS